MFILNYKSIYSSLIQQCHKKVRQSIVLCLSDGLPVWMFVFPISAEKVSAPERVLH